MRLRAWQLCWLALDAASAPANNLPDNADAQAWPLELIEKLRALPKLNAQAWQELRRARDQQLFATMLAKEPAAQSIANNALATMLAEAFARLGLEQLRAWITPSVTAAVTRWLSACFLAIDALALSDDTSDVAALDLAVFVQTTLQRVQGAVTTADDTASNLERAAAVSGSVVEAQLGDAPPATGLEPQPAAPPTGAAAAATVPSVPEPVSAVEQLPATPTGAQVATPPRRLKPRAIALGASAVAAAAALLLFLEPGNVAPAPDVTPKAAEAVPPVTAPEPSARAATPEPPPLQPVPTAKVNTPANTLQSSKQPRFRNVAAAKRAHAAKKIDDVAYAAAIAELEARRTAKTAKLQLELRSGKLSQSDYQRRVDAINKTLGFSSP